MNAESEETVVEEPTETQIEDEVTSPEETGSEEVEVSGDTATEDPAVEVAEGETPEPEPTETERSEQPQEQLAGTPFSFRVSGRDVAVAGAEILTIPDGEGGEAQRLVMTPDGWARGVQPYLQDASATKKREDELLGQIEALNPANNETVVRAQSLLDSFENVITDEASLAAFLENFEQNKELWKAKADLAAMTAQDSVRTTADEARASVEQDADTQRQIDEGIFNHSVNVYDQLNLDLGEDHKNAIGEYLYTYRKDFYRPATADESRSHGVAEGALVFDTDRAADVILHMARMAPVGPGQKSKTEQARKDNRAVLNPKPPPTTVPADGSPAPSTDKVTDFKDREEYEKWLDL